MKRSLFALAVLMAITAFSFLYSCTQKDIEKVECLEIENTLISVGIIKDSLQLGPTKLFAYIELLNEAIDSIGYPDAGYKLWIVQSDTVAAFRFMLNGFWPNQEVYDEIHNNEIYKKVAEDNREIWSILKVTWYTRFTRVK